MADEPQTIITKRAETPPGSDVTVVQMPAWKIILVRAARVYVQSLLGFLTANLTGFTQAVIGEGVDIYTFQDKFIVALSLAVAPTVFSLLQNIAELLGKLDVSNPQLRA